MNAPGAPGDGKDDAAKPAQAASPAQVIRAVLWSFIGIRKKSGYEDDVAKIKPVQVIVAGILMAALFVGCLVVLVRFLTAK
ncbi:MAG TPA: DUF2970 domain-containing protein [Burkholderiales bacterium]|jgi:hypothetical protein